MSNGRTGRGAVRKRCKLRIRVLSRGGVLYLGDVLIDDRQFEEACGSGCHSVHTKHHSRNTSMVEGGGDPIVVDEEASARMSAIVSESFEVEERGSVGHTEHPSEHVNKRGTAGVCRVVVLEVRVAVGEIKQSVAPKPGTGEFQ